MDKSIGAFENRPGSRGKGDLPPLKDGKVCTVFTVEFLSGCTLMFIILSD
jgi:hypothetical protein